MGKSKSNRRMRTGDLGETETPCTGVHTCQLCGRPCKGGRGLQMHMHACMRQTAAGKGDLTKPTAYGQPDCLKLRVTMTKQDRALAQRAQSEGAVVPSQSPLREGAKVVSGVAQSEPGRIEGSQMEPERIIGRQMEPERIIGSQMEPSVGHSVPRTRGSNSSSGILHRTCPSSGSFGVR